MRHFEFSAGPADEHKRLDVFLASVQDEASRSRIKKLIEENRVAVNGLAARASTLLKAGDRVTLDLPAPTPLAAKPEALPLAVVYEDDHLIVIDKPAGMVVHPAPGHREGTLVNALLAHCKNLSGIGGVERPGIVHRLDKETSGLVIAAKSEAAHRGLAKLFKTREIKKVYLAFVQGRLARDRGVIDLAIGRNRRHRKKMAADETHGRAAETAYEVIERRQGFTYLRLMPKTGRTHQIRVHLAALGHPIVGDKLYGGKTGANTPRMARQALHAHRLEFPHPVSGEPLSLLAPLPSDMAKMLEAP